MGRNVAPGRGGSAAKEEVATMAKTEDKGSGLRMRDGLILVVVGIVGVLLAFWALSWIAGLIWGVVKVALLLAVLVGIVWVLMSRRSKD
jgi:Flp pilus assembly protein TadB